jgi:hypothetical protein
MPEKSQKRSYNGRLSIPLDFNEAVQAALEVKPPQKPKRKPRSKKKTAKKKS